MSNSDLTRIFAISTPGDGAAVETSSATSRRTFIKISGAGLVLGLMPLPEGAGLGGAAEAAATSLAPNPFLVIAPDDTVTVIIKHLDKGQGAATGLASLAAEELDADWSQIRTVFAPADATKYKNLEFGVQGVGGSNGLSNAYSQYREAGATARAMLVSAAASAWKVPAAEITVKAGKLAHSSGKSASFGEMAQAAAIVAVPKSVKLKDAKDFVFIGKSFPRVDSVAKSNGTAKYTIDQQMDGMLVAVIARPPKFGATVKSVDASATEKIAGVVRVITIPQGVAVLAKSTWPAIKGREALKIVWDESKAETRGTAEIFAEYRAALDKPGLPVRAEGDAAAAMAKAAKVVSVDFEFPYLAHATMEPMNAVVRFNGTKAEIWTGSQLQTVDQGVAAAILGIKPENVSLTTLWAGGSFGRRAVPDAHFVAEACMIAKAYGQPVPIKTIWTREDDIKGGYYRPAYLHRIKAGLDASGKIIAWRHVIVGQSIIAGTPFEAMAVKDGIDLSSVEGANNLPYAIPNFKLELTTTKIGVPVLWWRSVGSTHTAHATEHMIDILAREAGRDPLMFRMDLLAKHPRHAEALKLAAFKAGWDAPLPAGRFRGMALHESFKSYVAQVAEISLKDGGGFKVERVVCAVDCGIAVNPDVVVAQMEGGIGYGLGAAMKGAITLKGGAVEQSNFDDYEVLRMSEMPRIEVHIVPSTAPPTGVGEPGTPPILPAVANALLAATGVRTVALPMTRQKYLKA